MRNIGMKRTIGLAAAVLTLFSGGVKAQDRLKTMPAYARFQQSSQDLNAVMSSYYKSGIGGVVWADDGKTLGYAKGGKNFRYDLTTYRASEVEQPVKGVAQPGGGRRRGGDGLERGRQYASATSPDGKRKAREQRSGSISDRLRERCLRRGLAHR